MQMQMKTKYFERLIICIEKQDYIAMIPGR
jgi:hypothetical protein